MTREELIHRVKVKLEELSPYGYEAPLIAIQEDSQITENINKEIKPIISYISETLESSCNAILSVLPLHMINYKESNTPNIAYSTPTQVMVEMPNDFLRLHSAWVTDWVRPVTRAISEENPLSLYEANPHTMGKPTRPVVVQKRIDNKIHFQLNSGKWENPNAFYVRYVARFDDTNIQDSLSEYYALQTAIDVCNIMRIDSSKLSEELARVIQLSNF
jgi:hypothetical protein